MKKLFFFFFLIHEIFCPSSIDGTLATSYPFSIKKGYDEVIIFMGNLITIYKPNNINDNSIYDCLSGTEKGGLYYNGYYYTSCLVSGATNQFQIKIYDSNFNIRSTISDSTHYFLNEHSTIRFFKVTSEEELVGVAWRDTAGFHLLYLKGIEESSRGDFTLTGLARDMDCLYIRKHQRTICVFGQNSVENGISKIVCSANIFDGTIKKSDYKVLNTACTSHHSRKIRGYTNIINDPDNSDFFYYYYVDTNNDAYVMVTRLKSQVEFETGGIYKVMTLCDSFQYNYDIAEDKFLGYDVFICLNFDKIRIKVQLFKIENNQIIFYNGNVNTPSYTFYDDTNSQYSMINFVVLKETLNFGFLSYRVEGNNQAKFTVFNQPTCIPFPTAEQENDDVNKLSLFGKSPSPVDFTDNIYNDGFNGAEIIIVNMNSRIKVTVDNKVKVVFESIDYVDDVDDEIEFTFKVKNDYFESDICTGKVYIFGCYKNCKTCSSEQTDFKEQECITCREGYYKIKDFPTLGYDKNCCKESLDCPDYFYFKDNQFEICDNSCLTCKNISTNCQTCYNEIELNKYSQDEQDIITTLKHTSPNYYWEDESHKKCITGEISRHYPNITLMSYKPCYESCETCNGDPNSLIIIVLHVFGMKMM